MTGSSALLEAESFMQQMLCLTHSGEKIQVKGKHKQLFNFCYAIRMYWMCVCVSVCVIALMNLSGLRAGGDVTADRLPAGMLRAPTVCVPSFQSPYHPAPLFLSQSSAPHICCVLATDSKLQHPGPLSNSILISSHAPPPYSTIIQLTFSASVYLPPFSHFDLFSFHCLSYSSWLLDSLNPVRFLSPVCLSLTSVILLILHSSIVSRYTAFPPLHIPSAPPLLSYKQVPVV